MQGDVPTVGHHVLVELFGCDRTKLDDPAVVRVSLLAAVAAIGATPVGEVFHRFSPQGVSGVVLIAESHLSCHTWPEAGYVAIDIYTCGVVDPHGAVDHLRRALRAETWLVQDIVRGLVDFAPETPVERTSAMFDRRQFHRPGAQRRELLRSNGIVDVSDHVSAERFDAVRRDPVGLGRALCDSRAFVEPLERIAGEPFGGGACRSSRGTGGWIWGSGACTLVWVLDAPDDLRLQCVPNTRRDQPLLAVLTEHPIETYTFGAGQLFLLRADSTLHRTMPDPQGVHLLEMSWSRIVTAVTSDGPEAPRSR